MYNYIIIPKYYIGFFNIYMYEFILLYYTCLFSYKFKYIYNSNMSKDIDCVYDQKYSLVDIANIINNLDNYQNNDLQNARQK